MSFKNRAVAIHGHAVIKLSTRRGAVMINNVIFVGHALTFRRSLRELRFSTAVCVQFATLILPLIVTSKGAANGV